MQRPSMQLRLVPMHLAVPMQVSEGGSCWRGVDNSGCDLHKAEKKEKEGHADGKRQSRHRVYECRKGKQTAKAGRRMA